MYDPVEISPARPEDAETLIDIMIAALEPDLWPRFMFSEFREVAVRKQKEMFIPMITNRFKEGAYTTKATLRKSRQIVGYSLYQRYEGRFGEHPNALSTTEHSTGEQSFAEFFRKDTWKRYRRLVEGESHVGP